MFWDLFFHKQGIKQMQLDKSIYIMNQYDTWQRETLI